MQLNDFSLNDMTDETGIQIRNRPAPYASLKLIASVQGNTYGG